MNERIDKYKNVVMKSRIIHLKLGLFKAKFASHYHRPISDLYIHDLKFEPRWHHQSPINNNNDQIQC